MSVHSIFKLRLVFNPGGRSILAIIYIFVRDVTLYSSSSNKTLILAVFVPKFVPSIVKVFTVNVTPTTWGDTSLLHWYKQVSHFFLKILFIVNCNSFSMLVEVGLA